MRKLNLIRQLLFTIGMILIPSTFFANNQANNWVFGIGAGVSFSSTSPFSPSAISSSMNQAEGVASISDASGNLLFYTNGETIWNAAGVAVVTSGLFGHQSSTQSAIIVPDPGSTTEYYVFTVDRFAGAGGLQFVKYDVISETLVGSSTLLQSSVSEKITAVKKGDDSGYWVLAHEWGNNNFHVYEIDCDTLSHHSVQPVGAPHQGHINSTLGYMKFSSDGSRLAIANSYGNYSGVGAPGVADSFGFVQVFNFDNMTGIIATSGIVNIGLNGAGTEDDGSTLLTPYGLEFSQNGDFLYISEVGRTSSATAGRLFQYNFLTAAPPTVIGTANGGIYDIGALQMGRDGRIYVAIDQQNYLGVINNPEVSIGAGGNPLNIAANQFNLLPGDQVRLGLPNFVQSIFEEAVISITGNECSPTFQYTGSGAIATYNWDFGDGNTSSSASPTHTYATPGSYTVTLTITTIAGCLKEYSISVTAEDCCPILGGATDIIYHTTNETITTNTYWAGTHYVEDNVIITVATGATLDITNVDVIFGECAGINFNGGSTARINNSVLRPCDMLKTWRGLYFFPDIAGTKPTVTINESTFKNAQTGIYFNGTVATSARYLDMKLTNNLFLDNQMAIYLRNTVFGEHITGNTVTVEQDGLYNDVGCPGLTSATNRFGVYYWNVTATGKIAQNDFICTRSSATLNLAGVGMGSSSGLITENNFSNNSIAVSVRFGSNVEIENNEIGITANHTLSREQIGVHDCDMVNITGNQLVNSNEVNLDLMGTQSAIKIVNRCNNVWVRMNEIKGFETGIHVDQSNNITVAENDILNSWFYGIYFSAAFSGYDGLISCNTINMFNTPGSDVTGIGYYQTGTTDFRTKIYSNCIFETNQAIHLENTSGSTSNMPAIRNNFMYNYTRAGVENIGMSGNIGTSGVSHDLSGRNSFIGNNWPNQNGITTGDIISNTPIVQNGNYGVGLFTANVTGNANAGSFHSTSSCGGQNRWGNNFPNEIDVVEICDEVGNDLADMVEVIDGGLRLKSEVYGEVDNSSKAVLLLSYLNGKNPSMVEETYNRMKTESPLYGTDRVILDYTYYQLTGQHENALTLAEGVLSEWVSTQELFILQQLLENNAWTELSTEEQKTVLEEDHLTVAPTHLYNAEMFTTSEVELNIYPNPAVKDITIQLNVTAENPTVKIYDVRGQLLEMQNPAARNSLLQVDVSHLANGLYFVVVENNGLVTQGKFNKTAH